MKRFLLVVLCLCLSGCSFKKQEEEIISTETEIPVPDVTDETTQTISNNEISIQVQLPTPMKFAPKLTEEEYAVIYENAESFNSCNVELKYMPNYKLIQDAAINSQFKELQGGYVAIVTNYGVSDSDCARIIQGIQVSSYTGEE